jgi:hypothetical protein
MSTAVIGYFKGSKGCFKIMQNLRFETLQFVREPFLTPLVSAGKTLRFMNTHQFTALRTGPSFLFVPDEMPYPILLDLLKIVYHAHAIFGTIALIQVIQPVARKPVTAETVSDFTSPYILTVL